MLRLPESEVYEEQLRYMPYRDSLSKVIEYLCANSPQNSSLLDLMCGPGYLLGQVAEKRKDLSLVGVDLDEGNIGYSEKKYPHITFESGDVILWKPNKQFDVAVCTGALHHISYEYQETAVERISTMVKPEGFVIISDCYIGEYTSEAERKIAAIELGAKYLKETIQNKAPENVIEATIDILWNDVMMNEYKTSLQKRLPVLKKVFRDVKTLKTWPKFPSEYGDYISICRL